MPSPPAYLATPPPTSSPSKTPTQAPTVNAPYNIATDDWLQAGNGVSFPSDNQVVLESSSSSSSQFGVILTQDAYNDDDIDFIVEYTQADYPEQTGYQSQIYIFFVPENTSPDALCFSEV